MIYKFLKKRKLTGCYDESHCVCRTQNLNSFFIELGRYLTQNYFHCYFDLPHKVIELGILFAIVQLSKNYKYKQNEIKLWLL